MGRVQGNLQKPQRKFFHGFTVLVYFLLVSYGKPVRFVQYNYHIAFYLLEKLFVTAKNDLLYICEQRWDYRTAFLAEVSGHKLRFSQHGVFSGFLTTVFDPTKCYAIHEYIRLCL